jgi:hypothetical protein
MSKAKEQREWLRNERERWVMNEESLYIDWCAFARHKGVDPDMDCAKYDATMSAYIRANWREIDYYRKG